jgi:hypothetical protein
VQVIKSQGHCQRHGAKAKRCKIANCDKQAQGTHDGMCKRHWRAVHFPDRASAVLRADDLPPPPEGESVYDTVLPASIAYRPTMMMHSKQLANAAANAGAAPPGDASGNNNNPPKRQKEAPTGLAATAAAAAPDGTSAVLPPASAAATKGAVAGGGGVSVMPLVKVLGEGG